MPKIASGRNVLTLSLVTKPRSIHHLSGSMERDAVWHLRSAWSVTTPYARVCGGCGRSGSDSRWLPDCRIRQKWPRSGQQSRKTWARFSREMPPVEPEIESSQSERASIEREIHGSSTHVSRLLVPFSFRKDMLTQLHSILIGIGGWVRPCSWNSALAKNECWNRRLCFALHNLPNISPSTGSRGSWTTWIFLAPNRRGSVCRRAPDILDNGGLLV